MTWFVVSCLYLAGVKNLDFDLQLLEGGQG